MNRYDLNTGLSVLTEGIEKQTHSKNGMLKVFSAGGTA